MAHPSINESEQMEQIQSLKQKILRLQHEVWQLEKKLTIIQQNCRHSFIERDGMRKCVRCLMVESIYY